MHKHVVFLLLVFGVSVLCTTEDTRCDENDSQCITKLGQEIIRTAVRGNDEVEPLDPMYHELIEGGQEGFKYWVRDATVIGFNELITNEVKYISPVNYHIHLTFPRYQMSGILEIDGELNSNPLKANVKFILNATNINLQLNTTTQTYKKDGNTYLKHEDIVIKTELLGTTHLDQETLDDEKYKIPEPIMKHFNDNPKVLYVLFDAVSYANMRKLIKNINKLNENIVLEKIVKLGTYKE